MSPCRRCRPVAEEPRRSCRTRGGTTLMLAGCGGATPFMQDAREDVGTRPPRPGRSHRRAGRRHVANCWLDARRGRTWARATVHQAGNHLAKPPLTIRRGQEEQRTPNLTTPHLLLPHRHGEWAGSDCGRVCGDLRLSIRVSKTFLCSCNFASNCMGVTTI
jgi:hypothetical protein